MQFGSLLSTINILTHKTGGAEGIVIRIQIRSRIMVRLFGANQGSYVVSLRPTSPPDILVR